jgi:chromosome segregation ATPase
MCGALLFVAACDKERPAPAGGGNNPANPPAQAPKPGPGKAAEPNKPARPDKSALQKRKAEVEAELKRLKSEAAEMKTRHAEEAASLPQQSEVSALRRSFSGLRADAMRTSVKLNRMEKRLAELKKVAESSAASEVNELRAKEKAIEKRLQDANSVWSKARAEEAMGAVDESPVKKELDTIRSIKQRWFELTPEARRGKGTKSTINDAFRAWLGDKPFRKEVCAKVLTQPIAPKGKTPDNYDFSKLEFYVLLEERENEVDKQNIAVEKKEAAKREGVVDGITAELDAVREQIQQAMMSGGGELEEYADTQARIKSVRSMNTSMQTRLQEYRKMIDQVRDTKERHRTESYENEVATEKLEKELKALKRRLR